MDSVMSDFSAVYLGRPGLGDKMFDNTADHGPITSTFTSQSQFGHRNSFDPTMDEQRLSMEDSIFEKTGQPISISDDYSHSHRSVLLALYQFRLLSVLSVGSLHSPADDDDTMISVSLFEPCVYILLNPF